MRTFGKKILASFGNQEVMPADAPIWSVPAHPTAPTRLLIPAGRFFFYEKGKNVTIGNDGLVAGRKINICVSMLDGTARCVSGDGLYAEDIVNFRATAPDCGVTPVWDLLFKCVNCDEPHSLRIQYRDNNTEQMKNPGQWDSLDLTGIVTCAGCNNCTVEDYSKKLACDIENKLKMQAVEYSKIGSFLGNLTPQYAVPKVVRLFGTSNRWCISPANNGCANCTQFSAIAQVRITTPQVADPEQSDINTYDLVDYLATGSTTHSGIPQLDGVVDQLNTFAAIKGGSAVLAGGVKGNCCDTMIEINHCGTVELLDVEGNVITPCSTVSTLLDPVADPYNCVDCASAASSTTYLAGLRVIFPPVLAKCEPCNLAIPGTNFWGYDVTVEATMGFKPGSYHIRESIASRLPVNLGAQWVSEEYTQHPGGMGREYNGWNQYEGFLGNLTPNSRANKAVSTACSATYCAFHLAVHHKAGSGRANSVDHKAKWNNIFLIPSTDDVTLTSMQASLNILAANSPVIADDVNVICWDGAAFTQQFNQNGVTITE